MHDRPVEVTEAQITKWRAQGFMLGVWPYRTDALPMLVAWKAENVTEAAVRGAMCWHLGNYMRPGWTLGPCFQGRIPKQELREFNLAAYNQLVQLEQDRYDLLAESRRRIDALAPLTVFGDQQEAVRAAHR